VSRHCKCEKWELFSGMYDVPKWSESGTEFLFCPWCGVRLIAPCHICGTPSNEHTGNTLYWYEDMDFCSVACTRKLDMSFAGKETK